MIELRLLIVDDQSTVTDSLKEALEGRVEGIEEIITAKSAGEAKLVMSGFPVDILMTDIEMPGENGLSLFQWTMDRYPEIIGIFLTSHAEFAYAKEAVRLGGFDYILQPARIEEIEAMLGRAVKEAQKRKKIRRLSESSIQIKDQRETVLELLLIKAKENNRAECGRLYKKFVDLFSSEIGHCVLWTVRVKIVRAATKNNSWDPGLLMLVFQNILEELMQEMGASVVSAREDLGSYYLAAAAPEGRVSAEQWEHAIESFTSFINSHMDFQVSVFPDRLATRVYDSRQPVKHFAGSPGLYWEDSPQETSANDISERIRKAQDYIRENVGRSLSRTEVAEYLHINEDYFTRCFKKYTGYTFKDYDILVRMETAKTLLEQTRLPVSMIAGKVGFDNFSHFSQAFKKYSGKTPSEYR